MLPKVQTQTHAFGCTLRLDRISPACQVRFPRSSAADAPDIAAMVPDAHLPGLKANVRTLQPDGDISVLAQGILGLRVAEG